MRPKSNCPVCLFPCRTIKHLFGVMVLGDGSLLTFPADCSGLLCRRPPPLPLPLPPLPLSRFVSFEEELIDGYEAAVACLALSLPRYLRILLFNFEIRRPPAQGGVCKEPTTNGPSLPTCHKQLHGCHNLDEPMRTLSHIIIMLNVI